MKNKNVLAPIATDKKEAARYISDGSELIPAEVRAKTREEADHLHNRQLYDGYRVDDEGIINNYALEPDVYLAVSPSPEERNYYLLLGVGTVLLVTIAFLISFAVS